MWSISEMKKKGKASFQNIYKDHFRIYTKI